MNSKVTCFENLTIAFPKTLFLLAVFCCAKACNTPVARQQPNSIYLRSAFNSLIELCENGVVAISHILVQAFDGSRTGQKQRCCTCQNIRSFTYVDAFKTVYTCLSFFFFCMHSNETKLRKYARKYTVHMHTSHTCINKQCSTTLAGGAFSKLWVYRMHTLMSSKIELELALHSMYYYTQLK